MTSSTYQRVPSSSPPRQGEPSNKRHSESSSSSPIEEQEDQESPIQSASSSTLSTHRPHAASTRAAFNEPPPAAWKRIALILGIVGMFWIAVKVGNLGKTPPQVIYASRYSEQFKYRPAASPVITEHLPDGRIRLRGANPAGVGVRASDLPKTPRDIQRENEKLEKESLEKAKKMLGLDKGRGKRGKGSKKGKKKVGKPLVDEI